MSDDAQVRGALDGLGVPYEIVEIDPAFADTAAFCEKYGFGLDVSGNTIIVASKKEPKQYAACLVLAHTRLDVNHAVKRLMGASRVSFASASRSLKQRTPVFRERCGPPHWSGLQRCQHGSAPT